MAYSITYKDFNGLDTQILIYKGVESGIMNAYIERVEADIEETLPPPVYQITETDGKSSYRDTKTFETASFVGSGNAWDAQNWWFIFTIDGVDSEMYEYSFNEIGVGEVEIPDGGFNTDTNDMSLTTDIQFNITSANDKSIVSIYNDFLVGRDTITAYPSQATSLSPNLLLNTNFEGNGDWVDDDTAGVGDYWVAIRVPAEATATIVSGNGFASNAQRYVMDTTTTSYIYGISELNFPVVITIGETYNYTIKYRSNVTLYFMDSLNSPYTSVAANTGDAIQVSGTFVATGMPSGFLRIGWYPTIQKTTGDWFEVSEIYIGLHVEGSVPVVEAQDCLEARIGVLDGTAHDFCGTDNPLSYKYYADDKYSPFMASEVNIEVLIRDVADHTAMKQILNGGYYVSVYKRLTSWYPVWHGKLTSRFYTEAYAQYPYSIKLTGSDQLGSFERYQPLMIDFPIPDAQTNIISLLGKFLMDESMYPLNYAGNRVTDLFFSSRFTNDSITKIANDIYLDPLNWMDDKNEYASKKKMLGDILTALNMKIFQWNYSWYIMDFEAQWDAGEVTWNRYRFDNDGSVTSLSNHTQSGHFVYPYVENPAADRQVYNNAEMRYEPSWRLLEMSLNYQERTENIDGFTNISGNFYQGHDGVNLEFDDDGDLRHWDGDNDVISPYNDNDGWAKVNRIPNDAKFQYKETTITQSDYTELEFGVTMLGIRGISIPEINFEIKLTLDGDDKWLDNDDGASDDFTWSDTFRQIRLYNNGSHKLLIEMPYDSITNDFTLKVAIQSIPFPHGATGNTLIRQLFVNFVDSDWKAVEYKQLIEKEINPTESDTQIIKKKYDWGMYHNTLPNENTFHRSSMYYSDGTPIDKFEREGKPTDNYIMDWLGNIMIGDNNTYTRTLTASYFSQLTPLSLMVDDEGIVYRFVSGEFQDKISTWRNVYTQFKAIENVAGLPVRGDYSPQDYNDDYFT